MKYYKRIIKKRFYENESEWELWRVVETVKTEDISKFNKYKKIKFEEVSDEKELKILNNIWKFRQENAVYITMLNKIQEGDDNEDWKAEGEHKESCSYIQKCRKRL